MRFEVNFDCDYPDFIDSLKDIEESGGKILEQNYDYSDDGQGFAYVETSNYNLMMTKFKKTRGYHLCDRY